MILYFGILFLSVFLVLLLSMWFIAMKNFLRLSLISRYSKLYMTLKEIYKAKDERNSLFKTKDDVYYFASALSWVGPYVRMKKLWTDLPDKQLAVLGSRLLEAEERYPSALSLEIEKEIPYIIVSSIILYAPFVSIFKIITKQAPFSMQKKRKMQRKSVENKDMSFWQFIVKKMSRWIQRSISDSMELRNDYDGLRSKWKHA